MAFATRVSNLSALKNGLRVAFQRNLGASAVVASKLTDPIQNLFLSKLNEYNEKSSGLAEGELLEVSAEIEGEKQFMLDNLSKKYGKGDMEEVPTFSWQ